MKITIFSEELRKCLNAAGLSDCGENDTWNYWYQRLMNAYNESVERQIMTEQTENVKLREELEAAKHDLQVFSANLARLGDENAKLRELATYALKHIIEFECEVPDREMLRGKPCEDCADCGSSDCPKCMPRMFDVSGIEVD